MQIHLLTVTQREGGGTVSLGISRIKVIRLMCLLAQLLSPLLIQMPHTCLAQEQANFSHHDTLLTLKSLF